MDLMVFWTEFSQNELRKIYQYYRKRAGIRIAKNLVNGIFNETVKLKKTTENRSN